MIVGWLNGCWVVERVAGWSNGRLKLCSNGWLV